LFVNYTKKDLFFNSVLDDNTNSTPTGGIRQIQYKLKDGEASRKFVIDKVIEY